jgi:hypothetical protein
LYSSAAYVGRLTETDVQIGELGNVVSECKWSILHWATIK